MNPPVPSAPCFGSLAFAASTATTAKTVNDVDPRSVTVVETTGWLEDWKRPGGCKAWSTRKRSRHAASSTRLPHAQQRPRTCNREIFRPVDRTVISISPAGNISDQAPARRSNKPFSVVMESALQPIAMRPAARRSIRCTPRPNAIRLVWPRPDGNLVEVSLTEGWGQRSGRRAVFDVARARKSSKSSPALQNGTGGGALAWR